MKSKDEIQLEKLQKEAAKIWQWCLNNIDDPNWSVEKRKYNALSVDIDSCKKRIYFASHKNSDPHPKTHYYKSYRSN